MWFKMHIPGKKIAVFGRFKAAADEAYLCEDFEGCDREASLSARWYDIARAGSELRCGGVESPCERLNVRFTGLSEREQRTIEFDQVAMVDLRGVECEVGVIDDSGCSQRR
jgi:hypothetical protein